MNTLGVYTRFRPMASMLWNPFEQGPKPLDRNCPACQNKGKVGGCPNCGRNN